MIVVGLTGGIGMGKSTVARMMVYLGLPVFDADQYVHRALNARGIAVMDVAAAFPSAYDRNGKKINRGILGAWITGRVNERKKLEAILHPLVRAAEIRFIKRHAKAKTPLIVLDIPLLFETGADQLCDTVICVSAPPAVRRARVMQRRGMTDERFKAIVAAQMKESARRKRASFILDTGGTHEKTKNDLQKLIMRIKKNHARDRS